MLRETHAYEFSHHLWVSFCWQLYLIWLTVTNQWSKELMHWVWELVLYVLRLTCNTLLVKMAKNVKEINLSFLSDNRLKRLISPSNLGNQLRCRRLYIWIFKKVKLLRMLFITEHAMELHRKIKLLIALSLKLVLVCRLDNFFFILRGWLANLPNTTFWNSVVMKFVKHLHFNCE